MLKCKGSGDRNLKENTVTHCLKDNEIEAYVLQKEFFIEGNEIEILSHIENCNKCCRKYFKLRMFHQILSKELNEPISSQILNLVDELQSN